MGRERLHTGEVGLPGTGDTINAGGVKLRNNMEELFATYSDHRLMDVVKDATEDEVWALIHSACYYQHYPLSHFADEIDSGRCYDIDSSLGDWNIKLPEIVTNIPLVNDKKFARRGERINFQDSAKSWPESPVTVTAYAGQTIEGKSSVTINEPFRHIDFIAGKDGNWLMKATAISGKSGKALIDKTVTIINTTERIEIGSVDSYDSVKLMVYAEQYDAALLKNTNWSSSEMLLLNNQHELYMTQFAVSETASLYSIAPVVVDEIMYLDVTPNPGVTRLNFTLHSIQVVKQSALFQFPVRKSSIMPWSVRTTVSSQSALDYDIL